MELEDLQAYSKKFVTDNLRQMAGEYYELEQTGLLRNGKVRELARLWKEHCQDDDTLAIVNSFFKSAAIDFIVCAPLDIL
jgi:hypothetical protein